MIHSHSTVAGGLSVRRWASPTSTWTNLQMASWFASLPLDRCRGLVRDVVHDAVDLVLEPRVVRDAAGDLGKHVKGHGDSRRRHGVETLHCADRHRLTISAKVALHAHGGGIGKDREVLPRVHHLPGLDGSIDLRLDDVARLA